jgi:DNA-binding CsgD family transcriptional regulator
MFNNYDVTISKPADILTAAIRLREIAESLGPFSVVICEDLSIADPMRDAEGRILAKEVFKWEKRCNWYINKFLALNDPISEACRYESVPFCFSEGRFIGNGPSDMLGRINVADLYKLGFTPSGGIVAPIHMAMGTIGAMGWYTFDDSFDVVPVFRKHADDIFVMASRFINGYRKVTARHNRIITKILPLTRREVLCLKWAAFGKTDEEIALIIERSTSTVRFHLNNAAVKLNTSNRAQTVVKAAQLGFIGQYHIPANLAYYT